MSVLEFSREFNTYRKRLKGGRYYIALCHRLTLQFNTPLHSRGGYYSQIFWVFVLLFPFPFVPIDFLEDKLISREKKGRARARYCTEISSFTLYLMKRPVKKEHWRIVNSVSFIPSLCLVHSNSKKVPGFCSFLILQRNHIIHLVSWKNQAAGKQRPWKGRNL